MANIPLAYNIFFLYIDPLLCATGIYLAFFDPHTFITNGVPSFLRPHLLAPSSVSSSPTVLYLDPLSSFLLHSLGAWALSIFSLQLLLLHSYPRDVKIWKIFQFSVLLIDLGLVYGIYAAAGNAKGGYGVDQWLSGDWINNGTLATVILVRGAFLLGVGGVGTAASASQSSG